MNQHDQTISKLETPPARLENGYFSRQGIASVGELIGFFYIHRPVELFDKIRSLKGEVVCAESFLVRAIPGESDSVKEHLSLVLIAGNTRDFYVKSMAYDGESDSYLGSPVYSKVGLATIAHLFKAGVKKEDILKSADLGIPTLENINTQIVLDRSALIEKLQRMATELSSDPQVFRVSKYLVPPGEFKYLVEQGLVSEVQNSRSYFSVSTEGFAAHRRAFGHGDHNYIKGSFSGTLKDIVDSVSSQHGLLTSELNEEMVGHLLRYGYIQRVPAPEFMFTWCKK